MPRYIEFVPGEKYAPKDAEIADSPIWPDDGQLIEENEIIPDLDCSGRDHIEALIKIFNINTEIHWTERGAHFIFSKPFGMRKPRDGVCALGIPIEFKTSSNCPRGITVKRNGVEREVWNKGAREPLPDFFLTSRNYTSILGLGEGDGRNNALFAHKQKLNGHPLTEKICRFINEHVFDVPLDEQEFQNVIRQYTGSGGAENEYDLATNIKRDFKCVKYGNQIWWWNGKEYIYDGIPGETSLVKTVWEQRCPGKKARFITELFKQITDRTDPPKDIGFPIRFLNGILEDGEFTEFPGFDEFTPYFVKIEYDENAPVVEDVDTYLNQITDNDPAYLDLLTEALGYVFVTDPDRVRSIGKFFIFRGNGANGKSTLLSILETILGDRNCAHLSIRQLPDHTYFTSLIGKLANLGDDVESAAITDTQMKVLKNLCTCDSTQTRHMYSESFSISLTTKLFFTANENIKSWDKGYGYQRRVLWMPMFNTVEKPDPFFKRKLTTPEALKYWVKLMVAGYKRLYKNGRFTTCAKVDKFNEEYHTSNNHMAAFVSDIDIDTSILGKTATEVKALFDNWRDDPKQEYSSKLMEQVLGPMGIIKGRKKVQGEVKRVFMRASETRQAQ